MASIGTIKSSYIVQYDQNCENYENLDNKYIIKVKSSSLDGVISLFKEPKFERLIYEAFNCFIVCVEFESNEEEEEIDDEYTAMRLEGTFKADRLIILQMDKNLWIKKCLQKKFFNMKSPKMRKYHKLLDDINFDENIINSQIDLSRAIDYITPDTEDFVIILIKLFKFVNQKEVDKKLFEKALEQKCSFEVIQSMISFHKESSIGMSKHEVDALFLAKGITVFDEAIIENYKQELRKEDKEKITDEIEKYHVNEKSLLQHLCSRSRIALNTKETENERLQKIEEYFKNLIDLNLDSVTDLLKIVDHKLLMIFDFDSNSIERSYLMGSRINRGIFDQDRMRIFIGAKNSHHPSGQDYINRDWEIIGILIHEICHYVNFKVFKNNCKPYRKDDDYVKEYEEIINEYKRLTGHHEIVGRVFSDYEETMWHAELIVRAVQMVVTYKNLEPENLKILEEKYQKLFSFFFEILMRKIKDYLDPDNQLREQVKEVSTFRLDQIKLKPTMKPITYDAEKFVHLIETNSPKLAMTNFCLNFVKDFAIFTTFKDLTDEFKGNDILSLWCSDWRIKIVILCDQYNEDLKDFEECIKKLDSPDRLNQIFIIFKEQSKIIANIKEKFTKRIEIVYDLNFNFIELDDESKDIVLQNNVIFQGSQTALNKIITKDSEAAQFLPINHFLESIEPINVGKLPEMNADYDDKIFIQRKLTNKIEGQVVEFSTEKMDEILTLLSTQQYIIVSDEVGKGKSTLMTYLAYQFLQNTLTHIEGKFFVVKINLHQHANELQSFKDETDLDKFIFDNFVRTSNFEEFECKIFEEYFKKGKLVLMLDGFDEIAPNFEEHTFKIISKIVNSKSSNVIVATRTLFARKLNIHTFFLKLEPLSYEDQLKFLKNHLKSQANVRNNFSETEIIELCRQLCYKMFCSMKEDYDLKGKFVNLMMSYPLHLRMFADIILGKIQENLSSYENAMSSITCLNDYNLYVEFFLNKVRIAQEDKGTVVKTDIRNSEHKEFKKLQLFKCAKKLALNVLHPAFKINPLNIDDKEKKFLQRYGIVTIQNNQIYFVHRSYAEFFIAHLFLKELLNGTLMSSHFARDHFLIDILTLVDYEKCKRFIDTAVSDERIYQNISSEIFNILGQFVIKEFKEIEGNDKNFLHCIIDHAKKYNPKVGFKTDFVFISHLLIDSLMHCDSDEDIKTIKNILEMAWDEDCECISFFNGRCFPATYPISITNQIESSSKINGQKNIFHLVCKMGLNCLVSTIWKLAEKVYGKEAIKYFFTPCLKDRQKINVFQLALDVKPTINDPLLNRINIRNCLEIEELRRLRYLQEDNDIDLSDESNFHLSTAFSLLQIVKKFDLNEEQLESLCINYTNFYEVENVYLNLHYYFYLISNFFKAKKSINSRNICYVVFNAIRCIREIRTDIPDNVELNVTKILKFLKEKLCNEYNQFIKDFFIVFLQSKTIPFWSWPWHNMEVKAKIIYSELKRVFDNSDEISKYFQENSEFSSFLIKNGDYNNMKQCIEIYFKVLDDNHLILLLLNENHENFNIINFIISHFETKCLEHFLSFLKKKFDNEKLYYLIEKSNALSYAAFNEENFLKVFEFCNENFGNSEIVNLLFSVDYECKIMLKYPIVCNIIQNFLKTTFDDKKWKIFLYKKDQNNATIILQTLKNDWIESGKILLSVAKEKLVLRDYSKLMNFKDRHNNSIMSLKKLKKFT